MRSKLHNFISAADYFGALTQISFLNNDVKFRSIYGGILSIMIYFLGITYFLYLMVMWQTYQIPPIVTTQVKTNTGLRFHRLINPIFDFSLEVDRTSQVENILQKKKFLYDLVTQSTDSNDELIQQNLIDNICSEVHSSLIEITPICINLNDQYQTNLYSNYNNRSQDTYIDFYLNQCDPSTNVNCMSFEDQLFLLEAPNTDWRLTLITQSVDIKTGDLTSIGQDYYFAVQNYSSPGSTFNFGLKIKKATYIIDTGILFPNEKVIEIVTSISLTTDKDNRFDPLSKKFPLIADITYSLDRQEEIIRVTYPKLGGILADLGSIIQVLLLLGLFMNRYNSNQMREKILDVLLSMYFPQIQYFEFNYNWRGKIKSILFEGQALAGFELQQIQQFKENTKNQLQSKLNFINTLHEISRLQIQMQLKVPRTELIELQQLGYDMDLPFSNTPGYKVANEKFKILDQQDFKLFIHNPENFNVKVRNRNKTPQTTKFFQQADLFSIRDETPIIQIVK